MVGDVTVTVVNTPTGRAEALALVAARGLTVVRIDYPDPQTAVYHCRPAGHRPTLTTPHTPPLRTGLHGDGI